MGDYEDSQKANQNLESDCEVTNNEIDSSLEDDVNKFEKSNFDVEHFFSDKYFFFVGLAGTIIIYFFVCSFPKLTGQIMLVFCSLLIVLAYFIINQKVKDGRRTENLEVLDIKNNVNMLKNSLDDVQEKVNGLEQNSKKLHMSMETLEKEMAAFQEEMYEYRDNIIKEIKARQMVFLEEDVVEKELQKEIEKAPDNSKLKLLCYGKKDFEYIIEYILGLELKRNIQVEIVMRNVDKSDDYRISEDDFKAIKKYMVNILGKRRKNITIYSAKYVPQFKAAALYVPEDSKESANKLVWCSIQPYKICADENGVLTINTEFASPLFVIRAENRMLDFEHLSKFFEAEYERVKDEEARAELTEGNQFRYTARGAGYD